MYTLILLLTIASPPPANQYQLRLERVLDGDTIEADIMLGFDVTLDDQSIRLQGFDAWEVSRRRRTVTVTDDELAKGAIAKKELTELLATHKGRIYLRPAKEGRGVYGRVVGYLVIYTKDGDIIDVDKWMKGRGHARE
jgi:endonuclease YncB( thermonuclease family)